MNTSTTPAAVGSGEEVRPSAHSGGHDWKDDGLDSRKGQYWYRCARCGAADWIARYGTQDQLMPRECKPFQWPWLDDDGMPLDGSNPNPPECGPRA